MAVDLSVEFCGVKFKNPFILSSSPASRSAVLKKAAEAGWAGAVTWGGEMQVPPDTAPEMETACWYTLPGKVKRIDRPPAFWSFQVSSFRSEFKVDDATYPVKTAERTVKKSKESGLPVIANISGGFDPESWLGTAIAVEKAGADMLELNFSYAIAPGRGLHLGWHRDLERTKSIIQAIRGKSALPIMVKLNAFLVPQEIRDWAKACVAAGADAISITNSMPGFAGVDVETGMPLSACLDRDGAVRGIVEIITGPATKPIALAGVALVDSAVDVPIAAIGGIADWQDAVEYMMLGASIMQVGSAAMAYGHRLVRDLTKGLEGFMERKGYRTIQDIVGMTSKRYDVGSLYTRHVLPQAQPRRIVLDEAKCNGCGRCLAPCQVHRSAIKIVDGVAVIDPSLCVKCNLCVLVCPEDAVRVEWEETIYQH